MELAILFWCYKEAGVCVSKLRLLRHYNPGTPIYVLFGGALADAQRFETEFLPYINDFYVFPEEKTPQWKWKHGDVLISRWFRERGHGLTWDSITVIQWDMLVFAPVEQLFSHVKKDEFLLPGARPVAEVRERCYWVMPQYDHYQDYQDFLCEYGLQEEDAWYCALIVAVFPRAFLERFSERKNPETGFLEYTIPTLAKLWGFDFCTQHPYVPWYTGPIFCKDNPHPYDKMLNSVQEECADRYVLLHLLDPWGLRIFHPYTRGLAAERLSPALPAWLNFLRCNEWDYADLLGESTRAMARHAIAGYDLALPDPVTTRPAICLNMIVRNDAHHIRETLDSVAPHISSWVIVDTGSDDGTQDLVTSHLAGLGIRGELYERPLRDVGDSRAEALTLAQDHGDYIWVVDADDTVVGTPDFTRLGADVYWLRCVDNDGNTFWRAQLFRDGFRARYGGVVDEYTARDDDYSSVGVRLEGEYHIEARRPSARNLETQTPGRDRDLLLAEVERKPDDPQLVFKLAENCFNLGDFGNARKWYARMAEVLVEKPGWNEQVYYAMYRVAQSMSNLGAAWPDVEEAYLAAWEIRPTRAEPLYDIARRYRVDQRYELGHLFAEHAAEIPFPEHDTMFVRADIYGWRIADEQAVCASWIGRHAEAFTLWRRVLAGSGIPDDDRQRIAGNRDVCVPTMLDAASPYPGALVRSLQHLVAGERSAEVVVSLVAGPDRAGTEQTLNSFLNCCLDVSRVGRFLVVDAGLSTQDRAMLGDLYGFLEFADPGPLADPISLEGVRGPGALLASVRAQIDGRFWLHLGQGWRFFAPEKLIARLVAVLQAEEQVFQVGVNFTDAVKLTGACAAEPVVRCAPDAGRYVLTDSPASGPAMFDSTRLDRTGGITDTNPDPLAELGRRAAAAGLRTASLDEVLCISAF